jgi:hypothetical protein
VGAYTPDWSALIQSDAGLKDAQAALASGGAQDQAALNAEIANAYESFGKPIDLTALAQRLGMSAADLQGALGPDVQKLAQENTNSGVSTTARLDAANSKATRAIIANLNRKGILNSGEAGYELDQQNQGYRQASSDAYDKFLGYLQQYQQGYLAAQNQRAQTLAGSIGSAADRVGTEYHGTAGVTAYPDHQDAAGNWVFKGTDGNFYNADKSPYTAPTPTAPPVTPTDALARYVRGGVNQAV